MDDKKLIVFQDQKIRRIWFNDEWWFSIIDIIEALTQTERPRKYWSDLKIKLYQDGFEVSEKIGQLKLIAEDGKQRLTDCANTKNLFRIIQSIPSSKAEPFKQWLAQVGYDRIQEIEDPELAQNRVKEYYELKGYPKEWIDKRLRGIAVRIELTEEWQKRGLKERRDFAILTNEIHKAVFDVPIKKHKQIKNIIEKSKINLRDHMTDLELIFSMLGEKATTEITQIKDLKGFSNLKNASKKGGNISKNARLELEKETGKKVLSKNNNLNKNNLK
jgi:hypothetical protein